MDEVKLIEQIYLGDRDEMVEAINAKRLWIENSFYVPGNTEMTLDKDGLEHYQFIEALYNHTFLFKDVDFADKNFNAKECEDVEESSKDLAVFNLYDEIDNSVNCEFWVLYDFRLMDLSMYHDLVANLYHKLSYEELKIDKSKICEKGVDLMKSLIIGKKGQSILIISKDKLLDMCYYCPVLVKILYKANCRKELLDSLKEIALKNEIEIEAI
jgi:hypothetical protein